MNIVPHHKFCKREDTYKRLFAHLPVGMFLYSLAHSVHNKAHIYAIGILRQRLQSFYGYIELLLKKFEQSKVQHCLLVASTYCVALLFHWHHLNGQQQDRRCILLGTRFFLPSQCTKSEEKSVCTCLLHICAHSSIETFQLLLLQNNLLAIGKFVLKRSDIGMFVRDRISSHTHIEHIIAQTKVEQFTLPKSEFRTIHLNGILAAQTLQTLLDERRVRLQFIDASTHFYVIALFHFESVIQHLRKFHTAYEGFIQVFHFGNKFSTTRHIFTSKDKYSYKRAR